MRTIHLNNCKICKSTNINEKFSCQDYFLTGEAFPLIQCNNCGFVFTNDYPEEIRIGNYYKSEKYISHSDTQKGILNSIYHVARKIMLSRKYRIIFDYSGIRKGTLLDIGCGTGYFAKQMQLKGWDVTGIEKDEIARDYAAKVNSINTFGSNKIESLDPKSFDCITLWHVLEHFHDPDRIITQSREALKDSGIMVIALPNNKSFDALHYGKYWAAWDVPRHLWHFNPENLSEYLGQFGYEVIGIRRLPLDAFYISVLSEQYRGKKPGLIMGMFWGFVSWMNSLTNREETSSLVYIARKKKG